VIFGIAAWIIYTRYEKRIARGEIREEVEEASSEDVACVS